MGIACTSEKDLLLVERIHDLLTQQVWTQGEIANIYKHFMTDRFCQINLVWDLHEGVYQLKSKDRFVSEVCNHYSITKLLMGLFSTYTEVSYNQRDKLFLILCENDRYPCMVNTI